MEHQHSNGIVFDYTNFLGASCKKKWTFLEALQSIAPVFGSAWSHSMEELKTPEDKLWDRALNALSAQCSDESNLVRLVELARSEGIAELTVKMPYDLDSDQKSEIREKSGCRITDIGEEDFFIELEPETAKAAGY